LRLTFWASLKWTILFFVVIESVGLVGSLLYFALKLAHSNATLGPPTLGEVALELALRFAMVGLLLFAFVSLSDVSHLPSTITRQSALLTARAVWSSCLAAIALYALVGEKTPRSARQGWHLSAWSLATVALGTVITALFFRRRILHLANLKLRSDPHDPKALNQWRRATIASIVLAMSIGLYGFSLRMSGNARTIEWSFFFAAIALLFLWRPQFNAAANNSGLSSD